MPITSLPLGAPKEDYYGRVHAAAIPQLQAGASHQSTTRLFILLGPLRNLETSKLEILGFVAKLHEKEPQHWQVQYHEALAGQVNRVRARPVGGLGLGPEPVLGLAPTPVRAEEKWSARGSGPYGS
ncbi:Melanoma-associated antigen F1 [Myotis brandtii]|uniref:Melanoma-associated antigen F1 n=1 Tax=Myotis brandtii TaxID=109478 RepID=S7NZ22_MYOBR|nr:Melanoma-associated antigen F1 [Myotis brandtii]